MIITMIGHKGLPTRSGGIERHVEELSAGLLNLGHRVISFDRKWYVGDIAPMAGVDRRWSYGLRTKNLDAITHTFTALIIAMKDRSDIIHIHGVGPSLLAPIARLFHPRATIVCTFHCVDRYHAKWGWFARLMLRMGEWSACTFAHRTITVSQGLAGYCLREYDAQTSVIPNGVRLPKIQESTGILGDYQLIPDGYFAMITRLIPHKNVHVAIEAHRLMQERRPDLAKAYPLVIVGDASFTDEYVAELHKMGRLYPHIRFTGARHGNELHDLQRHATAHLSVSSSEGMSIALLESMAHKKPLIVSDIPENVEVTGQDAYIVRLNDPLSLSYAMENLLDLRAEEREAMGETLFARILANHDWERIANETVGVYEDARGFARSYHRKVV